MKKKEITLNDVRKDWRILDDDCVDFRNDVRLISHEVFSCEYGIPVDYVEPGKFIEVFRKIPLIYHLFYAARLLRSSDKKTVIIINGAVTYLWFWCGLFNSIPFIFNRKLICWDVFVEYILGKEKRLKIFPFIKITTKAKDLMARFVLRQYGLNVLWSKKQVSTHAKYFNLSEKFFIFIPFKANHSKRETYDIAMGNFIFAGGNGKRDYATLVNAVKGLDIPVIISATDPTVRKTIERLDNVVVLGASEPAFAQLQAASRFVVIPMSYSGLKGGGEANFCNAMWHRKPVVAVDSMAAEDYVLHEKTGYVVASGDIDGLQKVIELLWNDPEKCQRMGEEGRKHVEQYFTHSKSLRRLLRLARIYGMAN